jgi:hypothetical protein
MNRFFLFLIMLPKGLWRALGADVPQLKAILDVKLKLDDRRPLAFGRGASKKKKPAKYMSALSMFLSAIFGMVYIMPLMIPDPYMALWLYFSLFTVMLSIMLITDFSTVLFDARDKNILFPRPVGERTVLLSRMLHMLIYLMRIVLPMSLAGWVVVGFDKGWMAALWFPVAVAMLTLIALFFVNAVYLLLLRWVKPEKFKDVINYFQIAFSVCFFAMAYVMPRVASSPEFLAMKYLNYPWAKFTPTFWLAASYSWVAPGTLVLRLLSILSIAGPLLLIWLTVKYLSPSFAARIALIDTVADTGISTPKKEREERMAPVAAKTKANGKLYLLLADKLNKNPLSKAGFSIAWLQTDRSRNFKMRVYPTFAYVPVYFFFLATQSGKPLSEVWESLPQSGMYITLLYMTSFIVMQLIAMTVFSDQYKASWIYYSAPVAKPGAVMAGALKGIWVKYFMPMFLLVSAFVLYVWGAQKLLDVLLALTNISVFGLLIVRVTYRRLPFSAMEQMNEKGNRFLKSLFIMFVPFALGFGHFWAAKTPFVWLRGLFLVLALILLWMLWDSYRNTSWEEVKKVDLDS